MAGVSFDFAADVSKFLRGTQDVERALDDVGDSLDDLAREARRAGDEAGDAIGDSFSDSARQAGDDIGRVGDSLDDLASESRRSSSDAGNALGDAFNDAARKAADDLEKVADELDETAKESRDAADKMETSFRGIFDKVKTDADSAGKSIGADVKKGFDKAEDAGEDFKQESGQIARESATSFTGEFEDVTDVLRDLAANAFQGWGPAGAAAGIAVAAGIGIGVQLLQQAADEAEEAKQNVLELASEIADVGGNLSEVDMAARIREWGQAYADVKSWFEPWQEKSITNFEQMNDLIQSGATNWEDYGRAISGTDPEAYASERERLVKLLEAEKDALQEASTEIGNYTGKTDAQIQADRDAYNARKENVAMIQQGIDELDEQNGLTQDAIELAGIEQDAISDTTTALTALREERERGRDTLSNLISAENDYYEALQESTAAIEENGENWDASTEQGRENREAVLDTAEAQRDYIQSLIDSGRPMGEVASKLQEQRTDLYNLAIQAGATEEEAQALVDTMLGTPDEIRTNYEVDGIAEAQEAINGFIARNDGRKIRTYVETVGYSNGPTGPMVMRASGGYVPPGPGSDIDDRINARLSPGEYVLDKQATEQLGPGYLDLLNNGQKPATTTTTATEAVPAGPLVGTLIVQDERTAVRELEALRRRLYTQARLRNVI